MGSGNGPVVVKFGGSFARSVHLRHWVKAFAACAGRIVLVPGGGPFADAVRSAQSEMGFDNRAAHHMALLAMEQFGRALASLDGTLAAADSTDGIHRELAAEHVPVWMPTRMVLNAADLAASWDVTSDTLAAWLAATIGARRLFLVKHVEFSSTRVQCDELAAKHVVDKGLARQLRSGNAAAFLFGPTDQNALLDAIQGVGHAGIEIE